MHSSALLAWYILAHVLGDNSFDLARYRSTLLAGNLLALLAGHCATLLARNLLASLRNLIFLAARASGNATG